jgi:hypothetical protein
MMHTYCDWEILLKKVLDGGGLVGKYLDDQIEEAGYNPRYPEAIKVLSQW